MDREAIKLLVFFILLSVISAVAQAPAIQAGSPDAAGPVGIFLIMWSPGLAAIATALVFDRSVRGMGWQWGSSRLQAIAYSLPPASAIVVYGLVWSTGLASLNTVGFDNMIAKEFGLDGTMSTIGAIAALGTAGFLVNCLAVLGEEIGWRGYLFPKLNERIGFTRASLATGAIWAVWHYPGIIWGGYHGDGPLLYSLACFSIMLVSLSVVAGYLRVATGSLWSGVVLHASHNLYIQAVFDPMTTDGTAKSLLLTEWGVGTAIAYSVVAIVVLRHVAASSRPVCQ